MKAIVLNKYGRPELLKLENIDMPTPKKGEVLVRVVATAINDYDWSLVRGKPYLNRLMFGIAAPKIKIPGMELSGVVEARGENAEKFQIGDAVYGDTSEFGFGSFAEYVCVNENALAPKPESISFDVAASIPHAAMLAMQGLIEIGQIKEKQKILINGAGGGVGTFAFYIAKQFDAEITGVDTGEKLNVLSSMGFNHIIDYQQEDFTKNGQRYDLILDAKTNRSIFSYIRALSVGGKYVTVGGNLNRLFQAFVLKGLISKLYGKSVDVVVLKANKDLAYIESLFEAGKIKPSIDGPYKLSEIPRLIQYFGEGLHTGKIIVNLDENKAS